jgi:uncharacterized protein DUF4440
MTSRFVFVSIVCLTSLAVGQNQVPSPKTGDSKPPGTDSPLKDMFDSKIKVEWEAIKNKDKKAYGELLAEDYQGVEVDGKGERTKLQALNELAVTSAFNYTLWGLSVIPVGKDAALVTYEVTMQFPPKSAIRLSRVYISELWMKRAGQWKEVHYQETHVK